MKKKIKLTEQQYYNLTKFLVENINDDLKLVKANDILSFEVKGGKTVNLKVVSVNFSDNEILCYGPNNESIKLTFNGYDDSTNSLTYSTFDKNTKQFKPFKVNVENMKVWRDNDLVSSSDENEAGKTKPQPEPQEEPQPQPQQEPQQSVDDKSEPIELDPNITFTQLPEDVVNIQPEESLLITKEDGKNIKLDFIKKENEEYHFTDEEKKDYILTKTSWNSTNKTITLYTENEATGDFNKIKIQYENYSIVETNVNILKKYYKDIVNDPNMRAAFYTAPSLWNYFVAALKKEKAIGSGIYPALNLVNSYYERKIAEKFPGFTNKNNKMAELIFKTPVEIEYVTKGNKENVLSLSGKHVALVKPYIGGDGDSKVLINSQEGFKIKVKEPTGKKPDEFYCNVYVDKNKYSGEPDKFVQKNVIIKFLDSDGYKSDKNN